MKKKIVLFLFILCGLIGLDYSTYANELDDYKQDYNNPIQLIEGSYNCDYLKGINSNLDFDNSNFYLNLQKFFLNNIKSGKIYYDVDLSINGSINQYKVIINIYDNELGDLALLQNTNREYYVCNQLYGIDYTSANFFKSVDGNIVVSNVKNYGSENLVFSNEFLFNIKNTKYLSLGFIEYYYTNINNKYDNAVNLYVKSDNALPIDDLLKDISYEDNDSIYEHKILDNTYNPVDNKINVGTYNFTIVVCDDNLNLTYQKCFVNVVDIDGPIKTKGDLVINAPINKLLTAEEILKNYEFYDYGGIKETTIDLKDYPKNYNKMGSYPATIKTIDNYDNEMIYDLTINVEDSDFPIIMIADFTFYSSQTYQESDLLNYITVYDSCGECDIDIDDIDGFFSGVKLPSGTYKFKISATDTAGNVTSTNISVYIYDNTYPLINMDNIKIMISSNEEVTKEMLIAILNQSSSETITNIDTDYLSVLEYGEYDIKLYYDNDKVEDKKITISNGNQNTNISYEIPKKTKKEFPLAEVIIASIVFVALSISVVLLIITRKKHIN